MTFSSPGFLFGFMPITFLLYFLLPGWLRNAFLLIASHAFYFVDAGPISMVLLGSVVVNAVVGKLLHRLEGASARLLLASGAGRAA